MVSLETLARLPTKPHTDERDFVYHVTLRSRLGDIVSGLASNQSRGSQDWQRMENLMDLVRPDCIACMGISRVSSIYALPDSSVEAIYAKNTAPLKNGKDFLVTLEIEVDPENVIVCDAANISFIVGGIRGRRKARFSKTSVEYAQRYWQASLSLKDFRCSYSLEVNKSGLRCVRKPNVSEQLPYTFIYPEVLVPAPVNPGRLRWVSSSARPVKEYLDW
ncbi:TPA: hypothetical protein DIS56_03805 [Candidatus Saccharibacteria bacterium]|nr:MAG: hypothetical protein UX30_C0007G0085 [Candidatus Saccharibacteria bacterium GW2011_GWA2_46_10]OGL35578.1 MAG: hypothetical protein A3F05_00640 [Candidatus Saccharibacteria bacterium RIFCSPHIGHO2_12_FULL_47_17]HCM52222.1 hypothetical protein [Candidatus Saccharibacteria bacterium]